MRKLHPPLLVLVLLLTVAGLLAGLLVSPQWAMAAPPEMAMAQPQAATAQAEMAMAQPEAATVPPDIGTNPVQAAPAPKQTHRGLYDQIDALVLAAAKKADVTPAPLVDDDAFLRRVSVDLIGRIPTAAEYAAYRALPSETRREQVVDQLLSHRRYADRWTVFYDNVLRIRTSYALGGSELRRFIRRALAENMPYDDMVRELLVATGTPRENPAAGMITADEADPMQLAALVSQAFLGQRMSCAQCHDHPFDDWTQKQFYGLAAYFGRTKTYRRNQDTMPRVFVSNNRQVMWPPTPNEGPQKPMQPTWPLRPGSESFEAGRRASADEEALSAGDMIEELLAASEDTRSSGGSDVFSRLEQQHRDFSKNAKGASPAVDRMALADMVASPNNTQFARNLVNRVWHQLFGHGIVHEPDDFRPSNPPSHPLLLEHLAESFEASGYDFRGLIRAIVLTDTYQRSQYSGDNEEARGYAEALFVAARLRRMSPSALYDSIVAAGHLENPKHPAGTFLVERTIRIPIYDDEPAMMATEMAADEPAMVPPSAEQPAAIAGTDTAEAAMAMAPEAAPAVGPGTGDEEGNDVAAEESGETEGIAATEAGEAAEGIVATGAEREQPHMPVMAQPIVMDPYAAEGGVDLAALAMAADAAERGALAGVAVLTERPEDQVARIKMEQEKRDAAEARGLRYREVVQIVDMNPQFASAYRMGTPAPSEHFLRQFGQTPRQTLGEQPDDTPSTRQALILLNGRLTNEAARVGSLEPVYPMLEKNRPLEPAIRQVYIEVLTRLPSEDELAMASSLFAGPTTRLEAMADLRWVLLNSNEFRFLP